MTAKLSVLISVHNGGPALERCLKSVEGQSFKSLAIVVVDDASTDRTPEKLRKWQKRLKGRLTVVRNQENLGLTKSLNKGLRIITSPYTARIDADDWWHKYKLQKQVNFMDRNLDHGVVGCNYINVGLKGEKKVVLPEKDEELKRRIMTKNPFAHSCVVFRTDFIKRMGGYDENIRYGQDYELWLRSLPHTKFYNLQEFLCYRTVGRGISVERQREQMRQALRVRARYIKKYHLPIASYLGLFEPFILIITPNFLKTLKRKLFP